MTPRSRAASHISSVLIAAGSPIGSSSTSTMRGSRSTMSGEISISCSVDAVLRRDLARVDGVVRHGLQPLVLGPEGDRVGVDLLGGAVGQHGDDAGIQAAGQEAGHRHVGYQVGGDRLLDHRGRGRRGGPPQLPGATSATRQ